MPKVLYVDLDFRVLQPECSKMYKNDLEYANKVFQNAFGVYVQLGCFSLKRVPKFLFISKLPYNTLGYVTKIYFWLA